MTLPSININGTTASDLLEQQTEVLHSIRAVLVKLSLAAPHGRDYIDVYNATTSGRYYGGFDAAREEHFARINKIRDVMVEVEMIAEHCSDAVIAKEMSRRRL